jgi:hypothetical protein
MQQNLPGDVTMMEGYASIDKRLETRIADYRESKINSPLFHAYAAQDTPIREGRQHLRRGQ